MLIELDIPPGVVRAGTRYQSAGRWYDTNLVRWVDGNLRPIGGWRSMTGGAGPAEFSLTGKARGAHAWRGNDSAPYLAIGTHSKLYAYSGSDVFDITPAALASGRADTTSYTGYGIGAYGRWGYGVPRVTAGATALATTWTIQNFGQDMLAVHSDDGRLIKWDRNFASVATAVTASAGTVPTSNAAVVVTEERYAVLLGANGNPRRVFWSNQEDYTDWQITATKTTGDFDIESVGKLRNGWRVRGGTLLLTDEDAHIMEYVGPPYVYGFRRVGTGCGIVSKHGCVVTDDFAFWMSSGSFYVYDGYVKTLPCPVADYIFSDWNPVQAEKIFAVRVPAYREVWWFYPSSSATECDRYVSYSYTDGVWAIGSCSRTTGVPDGVFSQIFVGADGKMYEHEVGWQYSGDTPYAESGPAEVGDGSRVYRLQRLIPDERTAGQVTAEFTSWFYPNGSSQSFGPYTMANPTSVRMTGRNISVKLKSAGAYDWRVGRFKFDATPLGER